MVGLLVYYVIPKKVQWIWLLMMSYIYYFGYDIKSSLYMIFTTVVIYGGTNWLYAVQERSDLYLRAHKEELDKETKKQFKGKTKKKKRWIMILLLVLEFGVLAFVKYYVHLVPGLRTLTGMLGVQKTIAENILIPLGISFFTFQSVSYVLDVFMGKYKPEKNIFKVGLFVSFFPQILQGPIGRFDRLAPQLFGGQKYDLKNIQFGLQRMGWGLLKKFVLADRAAVFVKAAFATYPDAGGSISILAVLMYSIQLYMDFSGGIDVVLGAAEMFGIRMDENFRQPYFSKSIGEFWRRWHITLGTWMKDYIFYPMSLSKKMNRLGKWLKKYFGNHVGKMIPVCIANLVIFFIVGLWHGTEIRFIIYGLYNGVIIAFSNLCGPIYKKCQKALHIDPSRTWYQGFQMLRTFILVNIGWFFDASELGMNNALNMMKSIVTNFNPSALQAANMAKFGLVSSDYVMIIIGCVIVLVVSILKEKGIHIRESLAVKPIVVRWAAYYALFLMILLAGYASFAGTGFMYANF